MMKVLKYAIRKGHKKIVLIDPHDIRNFNTVPTINPIHYNAPVPAVIGGFMDSIRVLWGSSSFSETPRIQKYLPAVIAALHAGGYTLAELRYFMGVKTYANRRNKILDSLHELDIHRVQIDEAFSNRYTYEAFQSTINRLQPFLDPTMELIFGSNQSPLNFAKLISEGWLVLVNLDSEGVYGQEHQRLLGTIIFNEITYAVHRLRANGWKGIYYLYIDEAGDYATSKISYILDKKRKSGLRLTLSHQRFDQFSDKDVSSAVYGGTKIKVLFNTASREDRDKMLRMMYGGELQDRDVSFVLSQLKKQHAAIKINKQPPVTARIPDIPDIEMSADELNAWKASHYNSHPWYRSMTSVREEINNRFVLQPPKERQVKSAVRRDGTQPSQPEDTSGHEGSSVFDNIANSTAVLRDKKGRKRTKGSSQTPKAE